MMVRLLISVNVGRPRVIGESRGRKVVSGIFKDPVAGPVVVRTLNLEGDGQADLSVHGGEKKAVYVYPSEHYPYWRNRFPGTQMPWGAFGENFTTAGLLEEEVSVGDQVSIGSAEFEVTQPRFPCYKLGMRFGKGDMGKIFLDSERAGFYLRVTREGKVQAGEAIALNRSGRASGTTIASMVREVKREEEG